MTTDYSIIVPAYNEESTLEITLEHLKSAMESISLNGEIIVTDNNSTDRTAEIARKAGAKVVFEPVNQISRARNAGARHANGRYYIFVDADTIIPPLLLQRALNNLESGKCCGGGATISAEPRVLTLTAVLAYWNLISRTFRLAAGCFVYARRDDFIACGGFSEKVYATEEIWFSISLKGAARKHKRKFKIINSPKVITSSRKLAWYNHGYQLFLLFMISVFPFITRFKWVCNYWYKRPEQN